MLQACTNKALEYRFGVVSILCYSGKLFEKKIYPGGDKVMLYHYKAVIRDQEENL